MRKAGSVLSSLISQLGLEDRIRLDLMQRQWNTLFAEPLSLHTFPVEFSGKRLTIHVNSPAWLHQLQFLKRELLAKLQPFGVTDVVLRKGALPRLRSEKKAAEAPKCRELSADELEWVEETVRCVDDESLQNEIRRAALKSLSRRKKK
ncbi:MAG TPA: DUF721 domain-containing protein [Dissulfurispiraceae bacterium]|nr:DUF721 domain-containing protein [Dissulfurispiraceae bacterium]